jgi:hypothetical protein
MAAPLMLLTVVAIALALAIMVIASFAKNYFLLKVLAGAVALGVLVYVILLLASSLNSHEKILALNEPKQFCGFYLDCHMHVAVTSVSKTKTISGPGGVRAANGIFYVVTVKVFNDARRATIGLLEPQAFVTDQTGKQYERVDEAEQLLPGSTTAFDQRIGPEASFAKTLVFDLPERTTDPTLQVNEGYRIDRWLELFLVGDDDSLLHKKTKFRLEGPAGN